MVQMDDVVSELTDRPTARETLEELLVLVTPACESQRSVALFLDRLVADEGRLPPRRHP